jgi:hypothetical protein
LPSYMEPPSAVAARTVPATRPLLLSTEAESTDRKAAAMLDAEFHRPTEASDTRPCARAERATGSLTEGATGLSAGTTLAAGGVPPTPLRRRAPGRGTPLVIDVPCRRRPTQATRSSLFGSAQ